ncbi:MAG: AsnC family transcriptional regulator [Planctomycetota bacterium]
MDSLDRQILETVQSDFPLCRDPYEVLARRVGISVDEFRKRLEELIDVGVIRRLGIFLDSHKLGFSSTLVALSVGQTAVDRAAELISSFPEVTHSYLRTGEFNIWFTVLAADERAIEQILEQVRCRLKLDRSKILNLPMKRQFKLDARFKLS